MCVANGRRSRTRSVACASILASNGLRSGKLEIFLRDLVLKKLDLEDYLGLCAGGTTTERDLHGEKVVRLPDGSMLKLFRRKHLLLSALLYPLRPPEEYATSAALAWLMASPHFEEAYLAAFQTKPPVWCSDETD